MLAHVKCRIRVLISALTGQCNVVIEFVSYTVHVCVSVYNLLFVVECLPSMHLVLPLISSSKHIYT